MRHTFGGWSSHAVTDTAYFDKKKQGISGHYFVPRHGAYVELRGQDKYASLLDTCQRASIFFHNRGSVLLSARVNKGENKNYSLAPSDGLQQIQVDGRIGSIRWTVDRADSTLFYGLAMDGKKGIILDNFSLRGSSGLSLRGIPPHMLKQFNRQRPYDLIILEYGLNVATQRGRNYDNYQKGLLTAIEHLKTCFPQAGILLLSVGDRDYKNDNGELRTMPGVKNLIRYQQNIAAESGIAFWNMFEAMGGDGSMAKLVHAKPSMANYDYTHINFRGGKHLAGLLYETLIYGKEQYDRRRAYEKNNLQSIFIFILVGMLSVSCFFVKAIAQDRIPVCPPPGKTAKLIKPLREMNWTNDTITVQTSFPSAFRETGRMRLLTVSLCWLPSSNIFVRCVPDSPKIQSALFILAIAIYADISTLKPPAPVWQKLSVLFLI